MISTPPKMKKARRIRFSTVSPSKRYEGSVNEEPTPEGGMADEDSSSEKVYEERSLLEEQFG